MSRAKKGRTAMIKKDIGKETSDTILHSWDKAGPEGVHAQTVLRQSWGEDLGKVVEQERDDEEQRPQLALQEVQQKRHETCISDEHGGSETAWQGRRGRSGRVSLFRES